MNIWLVKAELSGLIAVLLKYKESPFVSVLLHHMATSLLSFLSFSS